METPNLSLSIQEGQKKGETFDRKPGSFIRIGRIIRGNTVAIKDSGISQKHLVIEFLSDLSRWTVTDLGSSNGTSVNGAFIPPNVAFCLSDGDRIKIGEKTSMSVKISASCLEPEPRTRRGRRVAAAAASSLMEKEIKEEKMSEMGKIVEKRVSAQSRSDKIEEEGKRRMQTRASSRVSVGKVEEKVGVREKPKRECRTRRGQRKTEIESDETFCNEKVLEKRVGEDCGSLNVSANRGIECYSRSLKEKEVREVRYEKANLRRKNACKEMGCLGETKEKIERLVDDGRGGHSKKGSLDVRVLWKDEVLGPKRTRGGQEKKKLMAALDLNSVNLTGQEKKKMIVKNNVFGDRKNVSLSKEVMSRIEKEDNEKEILMSGKFERKLAYSWSSFSKIRGIPNTTRKYREDKLIKCHATPFEARVERALSRGTSESYSSKKT